MILSADALCRDRHVSIAAPDEIRSSAQEKFISVEGTLADRKSSPSSFPLLARHEGIASDVRASRHHVFAYTEFPKSGKEPAKRTELVREGQVEKADPGGSIRYPAARKAGHVMNSCALRRLAWFHCEGRYAK